MKKISKFLAISALALTTIPTSVFAASETANVKVSIPVSLTLSLSADALNFNLEDANLHTNKLTVTAKTNAASGYTISFNANNDYNDLKHANTLVEDKIASIAEDKTETTFPETAWAYSTDISNYTFKKIPLESENVFATTSKGENSHDLTIGMRAKNIAAGDYENELIFTAVANPEPGPLTLSKITNMQEMTSEICAASAEHETKQLTDVRDNKTYWVTKMKDGSCWMTQNLDYDLSVTENQTLTPETSDVTMNRIVNPVQWSSYADRISYSDGGDNYYLNGTTKTEGYSSLPEDSIDRHYAQGDYYSWKAATAGQGSTSMRDGQDINESICPTGWRLPSSSADNMDHSFGNLLKQYGYSGYNEYIEAGDVYKEPLFFTNNGYVDYEGVAVAQSIKGQYWSSKAYYNDNNAYMLNIESDFLGPNSATARFCGLGIRCISR